MKRVFLLLAALATLLAPAAQTAATSVHSATAPTHTVGVSKIPPELCLAVLGSDVERTLCSG